MTKGEGRDSELLRPLKALPSMRLGLASYYRELSRSKDPILRVAAWRALIDLNAVIPSQYEQLIADCKFAGVRQKAFDFFESTFDHASAARAAATESINPELARSALMAGQIAGDAAAISAAEESLFLASGEPQHLMAMVTNAELSGGWRPGVEAAARAVAALPHQNALASVFMNLIEVARRASLMAEFAEKLRPVAAHPYMAVLLTMAQASCAQMEGDEAKCIALLKGLDRDPAVAKASALFRRNINLTLGVCLDKVGRYKEAFEAFVVRNNTDKQSDKFNGRDYYGQIDWRNNLKVPPLPPDPRIDTIQMLGFPRSGTTLLENVLNAHPLIETFEEIPALSAAIVHLRRVETFGPPASLQTPGPFLETRSRYYAEIDRRRKKPDALFLVDKLPLNSADAPFTQRLLPNLRYIFSIRHPFDVVFSCFRQAFGPNVAMANFYAIADAARLYDFVMNAWFSVHPLSDPAVHYVRYEELVTDFDRVVGDTLEFIGVPWDDDVHRFAEKAAGRATKTPSYRKVRQGLSLGVQTSWQNYEFLFRTPETKPLLRWTEFFGYETK